MQSAHGLFSRLSYGDEQVNRYYNYKGQEELFQAIHRLRPLRAETDKTILVYSEVPIRDVPLDGVLGDWRDWVDTIRRLCESGQPVTSSDVAREIGSSSIDSGRKRIDVRRELLASLADVDLVGTKFRLSNRTDSEMNGATGQSI